MVTVEWLETNGAEVSFYVEREDIPIRGNVSAIDGPTDAANERWVIDQLENGNEWAWCSVSCVAEFGGVSASDHLGCCSYESNDDFMQSGYADDMRRAALSALADKLNTLKGRLA